jgi:hypothetical protein
LTPAASPVDESLDALTQLRDEIRGALKGSTVRDVREALERRFDSFIFERNADTGKIRISAVLRQLAVYESWGQPTEGVDLPARALVTHDPCAKGNDLWESLAVVPD